MMAIRVKVDLIQGMRLMDRRTSQDQGLIMKDRNIITPHSQRKHNKTRSSSKLSYKAEHFDRLTGSDRQTGPDRMYFGPVLGPGFGPIRSSVSRSYLDKLVAAASAAHDNIVVEDEELRVLVQQVLSHYQEYFDEKSKAAESDVFLMFSPPWFSSFERTLLWASGFKPSIAFCLLRQSVGNELTQEQNEKISSLKQETRRMEKEISAALASVQESVAAQPFYGLIKREAVLVDGEVSDMENAVKELKAAMLSVMRDADYLRQQTAGEVLEVLTPIQKVKFLALTSQFWLHSRSL
nr:protein DOG1-like 4 [Tanacetum cinerariifolium]